MAEQLAACARQLLDGAAGSAEQRAANEWLMQFQLREEAWAAALRLLQLPARGAAAELVAVQILRLKIQHEWGRLDAQRKRIVRDALLHTLGDACVRPGGESISASSFRVACAAVADIVVQSYREWPTWKADIRQLVDAGFAAQSSLGATMLMEVLGSIPVQIVSASRAWDDVETQQVISAFQLETRDVISAVQMALASVPDAQLSALRCLESWIVGAVPISEGFGLNAIHLHESQLIDSLFSAATSIHEEQVQLASGILHDVFVYSSGLHSDLRLSLAVQHAGETLVRLQPIFHSPAEPMGYELHTSTCRGLSLVACALSMYHARALLSLAPSDNVDSVTDERHQRFQIMFLDLLLACATHQDAEVVLPTLEVWFFFMDNRPTQVELSWEMLEPAAQAHAFDVLGQLVNALINHCKYPSWFIDSAQVASDDPDVDVINVLRREIADTLLSLFSKWPSTHGGNSGDYLSCVEGIAQILEQSSDVGLINAILYLLNAMIELFDIESSDSESDDERVVESQAASEGIQVLQRVLIQCHSLPKHPLVVDALARYMRSLSATLVLPGPIILHATSTISKGLESGASFPVALQSLMHSSYHIVKYTTISERMPLLHSLLRYCNTVPEGVALSLKGDLLCVTFHIADGISDSEFAAFCATILANLTSQTQSEHAADACAGVYLLGRAISGVQSDAHNQRLFRQVWPLVDAALRRHHLTPVCRVNGPRFFLDVLECMSDEMLNSLQQRMLEACMEWYAHDIAPDVLKCCAKLVQKQDGNDDFTNTARHIFSTVMFGFRRKLHDQPGGDEPAGKQSLEVFLQAARNSELLTPEIEQFFSLARYTLRLFPEALASPPEEKAHTLYWDCLRLATLLLQIDHQVQEICDVACDFILEAVGARAGPCLAQAEPFIAPITRNVLAFLLPSRGTHYRPRSMWEFLFQLVHSPRIPEPVRAKFLEAVSTVGATDAELLSFLPPPSLQRLGHELARRSSRHRFRQHLAQLAAQAQAASA